MSFFVLLAMVIAGLAAELVMVRRKLFGSPLPRRMAEFESEITPSAMR